MIKINGVEVWRSKTHWDKSELNFNEVASLKLSKYTNIQIEMWDNDNGSDDLMSRWTGSVDSFSKETQLLGNCWRKGKQNYVHIKTEWSPGTTSVVATTRKTTLAGAQSIAKTTLKPSSIGSAQTEMTTTPVSLV